MDRSRASEGLRSIAANIRRLREKRGLTQEQLAEAAGLETRYVQTLESGRANPSAAVLIIVAGSLEVSVGTLFRPAQLRKQRPGRPKASASKPPARRS